MKLSKDALKVFSAMVNDRRSKRELYWKMYKMLNGGAFELISDAIRKEFKKPDTVNELEGRLVAINIFKKVIKKMASVYLEAPTRAPVDENTSDAELLEDYEDALKINIRQKQANRYIEAFQKNLKEFFTGNDGKPFVKNLPPHTYEVFNVNNPDKSQADVVCKIIVDGTDPTESVFYWYSDESFWITDGTGEIITDKMAKLENPQGKNPAKTLPFVYKCKSTDTVDPEIDDSLLRISIALPIVLTDLFFACKYQCWSMIYTIGVSGEIERNPSSIINLQRTEGDDKEPVVDSIQPTVDSEKVIAMVESTLAMFLSSLGLSAGTISLGGTPKDAISGVSKILDSAEVIEGKKDQQDDMLDDENMTWEKIKKLIPYWRRNQKLMASLNREFSKTFEVSTTFKEPKPLLSEKDALDLSKQKIDQHLTTWTRQLQEFYPDYTDDQIENLKTEILDEIKQYPDIYNPMAAIQDPNAVPDNNNANNILNDKAGKGKTKNGIQSKVSNKSSKNL
jgi:hypothetical protein